MPDEMVSISAKFAISGRLVAATPYGHGHINDTYLATYEQDGETRRYLHQRINDRVFRDPLALMRNIQRVTEHLRQKLSAADQADVWRRTLTVVPTRSGEACLDAGSDGYWRTYRFVEGARTHETIESPEQAYQAARAFGRFQVLLADLPGIRLVETIRDFHNTPKRWKAFEKVLTTAPPDRRTRAQAEIDIARSNETVAGTLAVLQARSTIPERIAHNDTKLNNVLFDVESGEAVCVVDLDTVMPGLSLHDFGDMVRTMSTTAPEDETDPSRVEVELPLFESVVRGYLESAGAMLTATERKHLVPAAKTIIFEQGLRFLTDYLDRDTYYKITRPGQNLDRARTQFALLQSIMRREDELNAHVNAVLEDTHPARY
ncbi:MAG: aminoglycoside phosphotransferase family protein [bacterium]|nr:aminoglycoside phosphotransferase family protein [bacterium]